ncbi:hypothetical protein TTHERM_01326820 (macronuclear) [Tetrahymena thermophila SB210]|uniref:Roadblock/LC7 domain protein n=1 Tax=Tetrahymena thermophila (strain SB210) TaxID=312017 RepID=Q229X1_TETTS|nr:hypothetical protein TTHERM_01326820 [Tetrahymena thermophila SB210]EAR82083.1 hypothetical protein TTHERM_01326820 [Tetrahymena thermophila SB210]|eukprot:XP_001029746.1 hypothetical protein TTHERM_01326820 [Tetrahymena thermophila SB210]
MFKPLKLNEFLSEITQREPSFKCVFLSSNQDGIIATNDWNQKSFISNMTALWEESIFVGQFLNNDIAAEQEEMGEECLSMNVSIQTQIVHHDNGTVILQNICNNLLFGVCSKKDPNHAILLQKAQNIKKLIEEEIKKASAA